MAKEKQPKDHAEQGKEIKTAADLIQDENSMAKAKDKQWMKAVVKWLRENHVKYPNPDISTKSLIANFKIEIKELIPND